MSQENIKLYEFGPFRLDVAKRQLTQKGKNIHLGGKTFDLLLAFVESPGELKTRDELIQAIWPHSIVEEHNLTNNVSALRKALGDEGEVPEYIQTVRGQGYCFIAPVSRLEAPSARIRPTRLTGRFGLPGALAGGAIVLIAAGLLAWYWLGGTPSRSHGHSHSLAVMPFENLSADKSNAYFVAGIQDTILTKLSGIGDLQVISRTSTEQYASHPQNLEKIARQLGVTNILEGSVQKSGNQVLINVQLINARTDSHIWAQTYTRTLNNVFNVESDVAEQVANGLKAKLMPSETERVTRAPTRNPRAYILFLKANYYASQIRGKTNAAHPIATTAKAISLYREATEVDSQYALAYARLSIFASYAYWYHLGPRPKLIAEAENAAARAMVLAPQLAESHLAKGYAEYYGHRDYDAALKQFEIARQKLPSNSDVIEAIAYIHRRQGKWELAVKELRQAETLDPRNPKCPYALGVTLMAMRRYPESEQQFNRALAIEPHNYNATDRRIWTLIFDGKLKQARQILDNIHNASDPRHFIATDRFEVAWLSRQPDKALAALKNAPDWVVDPTAIGKIPTNLLRARAWVMKGDKAQARLAYENAERTLQNALRNQPDEPNFTAFLGLAEARLGQKKAALHEGLRAVHLLPMARDPIDGTSPVITLAKIYAHIGQPEAAVRQLKKALSVPSGWAISIPLIKIDPIWAPIRNNPVFRKLLSAPTSHSSTSTSPSTTAH